MNKKEAINKLKKHRVGFGGNAAVRFDRVVSVINQINEQAKVVVPKVAIDYYEEYKDKLTGFDEWFGDFWDDTFLEEFPQAEQLSEWLYDNDKYTNLQRELALATLIVNGPDAVEIEKEKEYVVTDGNKLYLKEFDELNAVIIIDDVLGATDYAKRYSDLNEAQKAAAELGWKVVEVE